MPSSPTRKLEKCRPVVKYKDDNLSDKKDWTRYPCQNLSAVLNDPRRSVRETDFFTRLWGEEFVPQEVVPLTLLPNTPRFYFVDHYKKYEIVSSFVFMEHEVNIKIISCFISFFYSLSFWSIYFIENHQLFCFSF